MAQKQRMTKKRFLEYYYSSDRKMNDVEEYLDYALRHFELREARNYIAEWLYYVFYRAKFVNGKIRITDINDIIANAWVAITTQINRGNYRKRTKPSSWLLTILRITAQNFIKAEYYSTIEIDDEDSNSEKPHYFEDVGAERLIDMGEDENMILSFKDGESILELSDNTESNFLGLKYYLLSTLNKNLKPLLEDILQESINIDFNNIIDSFFEEHLDTLQLYVINKLQSMNGKKRSRVRNKKSYRQFFLIYVLSHLPENIKNKVYSYLSEHNISLKSFVQELERLCFAREDIFIVLRNKLREKVKDVFEISDIVLGILNEFPELTIHNLYRYKAKIHNYLKKRGYDIVLWKSVQNS